MNLRVSEIFYSLQGEGVNQGIPMTFVRLAGCNLLTYCKYCDTAYAWKGDTGESLTVEEIVKRVIKLSPQYQSWVCITGGEPLFQEEGLHELVKELKKWGGHHIEVETNSSIPKPYWWTLVDCWVADIKCPGSGVCGISLEGWFNTRYCDQVKFVVSTPEDLDFASKLIRRNATKAPQTIASPAIPLNTKVEDNQEWLQEVAEFCKKERVRMSIQSHKLIWGNIKGV